MAESTTGQATMSGQPPTAGRIPATGQAPANDSAPQLDLSAAEWQSSSRGVDEVRGDVQVAFVEGYVAMRHRRTPNVPALVFAPAEWRAFVQGAREGEFDLT